MNTEIKYRELTEDEIIEEGDEYFSESANKWYPTHDGGYAFTPKDEGFKYRRPIKHEN